MGIEMGMRNGNRKVPPVPREDDTYNQVGHHHQPISFNHDNEVPPVKMF